MSVDALWCLLFGAALRGFVLNWFGAGLSVGSGVGHGFRGARGRTAVQADSKAVLWPEPGAGSTGMSHSLLLRVSLIWLCQCGSGVYSVLSSVVVVHTMWYYLAWEAP